MHDRIPNVALVAQDVVVEILPPPCVGAIPSESVARPLFEHPHSLPRVGIGDSSLKDHMKMIGHEAVDRDGALVMSGGDAEGRDQGMNHIRSGQGELPAVNRAVKASATSP